MKNSPLSNLTSHAMNTSDFLASAGPYANATVTTKEADEIMLQTSGQLMARGILYDIVCKQISPGVCKLTLKPFAR